jgi:hypothetical protein
MVVVVAGVLLGGGLPIRSAVDCDDLTFTRIFGAARPEDGLNVLILGDGFQEEDLEDYRCAARLLVEGLLAEQPFRNFACHLNFYRADTFSSYDEIPDGCASSTTAREDIWTAAASDECPGSEPGPDVADIPELDLNVELCADGVTPRLLSATAGGEDDALEVAACAENIHTVIVLADTYTYGAGAKSGEAIPKLAYTTLDVIEQTTRHNKLAHELGHTMGLLDEYRDTDWESGTFHCGRNVWDRCQDCDADGSADNEPDDAFWSRYCSPAAEDAEAATVTGCDGDLVPARCRLGDCLCCPSDVEDCDNHACGDRPDEWPDVGFFEGGFYAGCGSFRSQYACRMESTDEDFCVACRCYSKDVFEDVSSRMVECDVESVCGDRYSENKLEDIGLRDCEDDDGTTVSPCPVWDDSPDILVEAARDPLGNIDASEVTVCFANVGKLAITGFTTYVETRVYLARRSPTLERIVAGAYPPPVAAATPLLSETDPAPGGGLGVGPVSPWEPGTRRCVSMTLDPMIRLSETPPEGQSFWAVIARPGDSPNGVNNVREDNNRARKSVAEIVAEVP